MRLFSNIDVFWIYYKILGIKFKGHMVDGAEPEIAAMASHLMAC